MKTPHFRAQVPPIGGNAEGGEEYYCTTGIGPGKRAHCSMPLPSHAGLIIIDIREATRDAVRYMITFLETERGLSRIEAYMLCSVAGDLRMHEVVCKH